MVFGKKEEEEGGRGNVKTKMEERPAESLKVIINSVGWS